MSDIADAVLYATSPTTYFMHNIDLNRHDNFMCGLLSGILARSITSPLDVVKILTQVSASNHQMTTSPSCYISHIYQRDGIKGFWNGNLISVINQGFYSGIKFLIVKEIISHQKSGKKKEDISHQKSGDEEGSFNVSPLRAAITGGVSGVIAQTIVFPLDLIRTRMIVNPYKYSSLSQTVEKIFQEEGILSFWTGLLPTIVGSIPYESSQYLIYGLILKQFQKCSSSTPLTPLQNAIAGTAAGTISATIAYPFESVRKLMMVDINNHKKVSMVKCFTDVVKNEGIGGLYRGVVLNAVKVIPYSALQYTLYDELCNGFLKMKKLFGNRRH